MGLFIWEKNLDMERIIRKTGTLIAATALLVCVNANAGEGTSKAEKYYAKAAQYEAMGDFAKADKYRAKGDRYSGESTNQPKPEKHADAHRDSCWPEVGADFSGDGYSVDVSSEKDLSNIVLLFSDGSTQRYEDLEGLSGTFSGSDANTGKFLTGVWIKSGCNHSGDGPGYGEFIEYTQATTGLPVVSISGAPVTVESGVGMFTEAMFTISLSEMVPPGGDPVTVNMEVVDGTAVFDEDYISDEFPIVFYPGQLSLDISVLIVGDSVYEEQQYETYTVEISNPVNALLGQSSATGTIIDDDGDF